MSHWQISSPDFDARLDELADLFRQSRYAFHELSDRYRWAPAPGSPAADDASKLPSPDPKITEPHGETGHRMIAEVVQTYLLTASGHLGGLAGLYARREVLFSPPLLIRAVIENCAHALWVLGDDPDESSECRLARAYLEELLSAEEAKKNTGRMRTKAHPSFAQAEADYKSMKRQILARFPESTPEELGKRLLGGQQLLNPEATVLWMYDLTLRAGGTIEREAASGIYGFLSNMTHPTLYPARQRRLWTDGADDGYRVANLTIDIGSVESEARAALAAFYNALTYTISYFGWPTTPLDDLEASIAATIPDFFR
jgi:hypothetical protein